jgi:DNA repair exonuclease SbcCD ATPase subunit
MAAFYNGQQSQQPQIQEISMLGKLFGFKKAAQPLVAKAKPAPSVQPKPVKPAAPSLLETLTQGRPLDNITDTEILHQLVKHSDKLDKKTNRQVREKIQHLKEQEKLQQQQHELQEKICVRLETLARLQHHPLFDSELAHLQTQYLQQRQAFSNPDDKLATRIQIAIASCQRIQQEANVLQQQQEQAAQHAEQLAQQQIAQEAQHAEMTALQAEKNQAEQEQKKLQKEQSQAEREQHDKQQKELSQNIAQQLTQLEETINNSEAKKSREIHDRIRDKLKKLDSETRTRLRWKTALTGRPAARSARLAIFCRHAKIGRTVRGNGKIDRH